MAVAPERHRRGGERGSTLTEAAFVTFPFFLLIFGVMEMGFLFRNYLTVSNTAAQAARAASVYGADRDADFQILRSADHGIGAMGLDDLEFVVVWRASGPSDTVPDACKTASQGPVTADPVDAVQYDPTVHQCNRYVPADFAKPYKLDTDSDGIPDTETDFFGCTSSSDNIDRAWCPMSRMDSLSDQRTATELGTDYVGIFVQAQHGFLTGFFQNTTTLSATKIIRIEPEES